MAYTNAMNYGSMYGNSAYPYVMPVNATMPTNMGATTMGGVSETFNPATGQMAQMGQVGQVGQAGMGQTPQLTGWQKFGYVMDGIGTLASLWGGIQQNKLAKRQLALQERNYNENMNNQIQTYNTSLEDRIRARYAMEGRSDQADAYLDQNRLTRS